MYLSFERELFHKIAERFNNSTTAQYLISCKKEALIIDECGFDVKLINQLPTSMHSSGEGHQLYIYQRLNKIVGRGGTHEVGGVKCDAHFAKRYEQVVLSGPDAVLEQVIADIDTFCAYDPVKERTERDERKRTQFFTTEDWRENKRKRSVGKRSACKKGSSPKKRERDVEKKSSPLAPEGTGKTETQWKCRKCTLLNPMSTKECSVCTYSYRVSKKSYNYK